MANLAPECTSYVERHLDEGSAWVARRLTADLVGYVSQTPLFSEGQTTRDQLIEEVRADEPDRIVVQERVFDEYRFLAGVAVSGVSDESLRDKDTRDTSYMARNLDRISPFVGDIEFNLDVGAYVGPIPDVRLVLQQHARQLALDRLAGRPIIGIDPAPRLYRQQTLPIELTPGAQ